MQIHLNRILYVRRPFGAWERGWPLLRFSAIFLGHSPPNGWFCSGYLSGIRIINIQYYGYPPRRKPVCDHVQKTCLVCRKNAGGASNHRIFISFFLSTIFIEPQNFLFILPFDQSSEVLRCDCHCPINCLISNSEVCDKMSNLCFIFWADLTAS